VEAPGHADPQGGADELPIDIPPMADISFSVEAVPQAGQGITLSRSP
jgi:hypothetical protein